MEYKVITDEWFDKVIAHLRESFLADEPLNKAAGLAEDACGNEELEKLSIKSLKDNVSIMAVNEEQVIAGVIVNGVLHPEDTQEALKMLEFSEDEGFKKVFRLIYANTMKRDIFEEFKVDKVFDIRILSVSPVFRGQGISLQLLERAEELAKENGFKVLKADATGIFSQKCFHARGFEVLSETCYANYLDEEGKPILDVAPPHKSVQLVCKLIE